MGEYTFHIPSTISIEYEGTRYNPGDLVVMPDACSMRDFLDAYAAKFPQAPIGDIRPGFCKSLDRECPRDVGYACYPLGSKPTTDDEKKDEDTDSVQTDFEDETSITLSAPGPGLKGEVDGDSTKEGEQDKRTPAEQVFDIDSPKPPDAIFDGDFFLDGVEEKDMKDAIDRAKKGEPPKSQPHPFRADEMVPYRKQSNDPVDLFTGEFYLSATDMSIPGRGFSFQLIRMYNSGRPSFGPWGYGWDHNYNVFLRELKDGSIAIWNGQLQEDVYRQREDGGFTSPIFKRSLLERGQSFAGDLSEYVLHLRGGARWVFARPESWSHPERIPLVRIEDRFKNNQQLFYDNECHLERVMDTFGREIRFQYGHCGLLEAVSDFTGRTVKYEHAPDVEHLVRVRTPSTANFPEGLTTTYEYDCYQSHPALKHNIVRVINALAQTTVENEYGSDPSSWDFNRVIRQQLPQGETLFTYQNLRFVPPEPGLINEPCMQTEVRESCSPLKVFTFNWGGQLLDERFRLCADQSYKICAKRYRYSALNSECIEVVRPSGLTMRFHYDETADDPRARSNITSVSLLPASTSAAQERRLYNFTYEPRFQQVKSIKDEAGAVTLFRFDYELDALGNGSGNIVTIVHPKVTLPDGTLQEALEQFEYNEHGEMALHTGAEGTATRFEFSEQSDGKFSRSIFLDPENRAERTEFLYDSLGRTVRRVNALGLVTDYEVDELGFVNSITNQEIGGASTTVRFEYNKLGVLVREFLPRGSYIDSVITSEFLINEYENDLLGRVIRVTNAKNSVSPKSWSFRYDSYDRVTNTVDPLGRETEAVYDERGLLLRVTTNSNSIDEQVVRYSYDLDGNRLSCREPGARRTDYLYDGFNRIKQILSPADSDGSRTVLNFHFGARDLVESVQITGVPRPGEEPLVLHAETVEYDERLRAIRSAKSGLIQSFHFDRENRIVSATDHRNISQTFDYDSASRLVSITKPEVGAWVMSYDLCGNLLSSAIVPFPVSANDQVQLESTFSYDNLGRLTNVSTPSGGASSIEYDARNLPVAVSSALGFRSYLQYDSSGMPIRQQLLFNDESDVMNTEWQRDEVGRVRAYIDAKGNVTAYELDGRDNMRRVIFADGSVHERIYDDKGDLLKEIDPNGSQIKYKFNSAGLVEQVSFVSGPTVAQTPILKYEYDGLGRAVIVSSGDRMTVLEYDLLGRLVRERTNEREFRWSHDDVGNSMRLTYPGGRIDEFSVDDAGRIAALNLIDSGQEQLALPSPGNILRYEYLSGGLLGARMLANGTRSEFKYSSKGLLEEIRHLDGEGNVFAYCAYRHDSDGKLRMAVKQPVPGGVEIFEYDRSNRLIAIYNTGGDELPNVLTQSELEELIASLTAQNTQFLQRFTLDKDDNRSAWTTVKDFQSTESNASINALNQMISLEELSPTTSHLRSFTFDKNGNCTADGVFTYQYDCLDQLVAVTRTANSELVASHQFDPWGRLVGVQDASGRREERIFVGPRVVERRDASTGALLEQTQYGLGLDESVLIAREDQLIFPYHDAVHSVIVTADASGTPIERFFYGPFGEPKAFTSAGVEKADSILEPCFGGRPYCRDLQLYDFRARFYDPVTGRFLQRDPSAYRDSSCLYVFCKHDPANHIDPSGMFFESAWDAFSLGLGLTSLYYDVKQGHVGWAILDFFGVVADTAALLLPFVPGGVGAAIKAGRAGHVALSAGTAAYKAERVVTGMQAITGAVNAGRGAMTSYEAFSEGRPLAGAFYAVMSAVGARGAIKKGGAAVSGNLIQAVAPTALYTTQGNIDKILGSGRIHGNTEGAVYATAHAEGAVLATGKRLSELAQPAGKITFEGQAAQLFYPQTPAGPLSLYKLLAGQYKGGFGDIKLKLAFPILKETPEFTSVAVSEAALDFAKFAGQKPGFWNLGYSGMDGATVRAVMRPTLEQFLNLFIIHEAGEGLRIEENPNIVFYEQTSWISGGINALAQYLSGQHPGSATQTAPSGGK